MPLVLTQSDPDSCAFCLLYRNRPRDREDPAHRTSSGTGSDGVPAAEVFHPTVSWV